MPLELKSPSSSAKKDTEALRIATNTAVRLGAQKSGAGLRRRGNSELAELRLNEDGTVQRPESSEGAEEPVGEDESATGFAGKVTRAAYLRGHYRGGAENKLFQMKLLALAEKGKDHEVSEGWEDLHDASSDAGIRCIETNQASSNFTSGSPMLKAARAKLQDKQRTTKAAYLASRAATQGHGGENRITLNARRLYLRDVQLAQKTPGPPNLLSLQNIRSCQSQVQHEIAHFFQQLCPKLRMRVKLLFDEVEDQRDAAHAIVELDTPAAAQEAMRALRHTCLWAWLRRWFSWA